MLLHRFKILQLWLLLATVATFSGCLKDTPPPSTDGLAIGGGSSARDSNSPPTISGSPNLAVMVSDAYSFTPRASDAEGDRLSFAVRNLPRWASFSATSGRLSGQPLLGDIGVYDNIEISVSDGQWRTTLRSFSITVTNTALGSMSLSWTAPTENTDGTALVDLAGYNIYFGKSQNNYTNRVRIDNPSISTYLVENLLPDTYYVVATSFNAIGVESTFSNVAVKTVPSD